MGPTQVGVMPDEKETSVYNAKGFPGKADGYSFIHGLRTFSSEVSVVGIRVVGNPEADTIRRLMWLCLVTFGVGFAVYQIAIQTSKYLGYPTSVNIKINNNETVLFPTVTICNENIFNKTAMDEYDPDLTAAFAILYPPLFDPDVYINHTAAAKLLAKHRHKNWAALYDRFFLNPLNLILRCTFNSAKCDRSLLSQPYTSAGRCIKFNSEGTLSLSQAGSQSGLQLTLLVDSNNYITPLSPSKGFRVNFHHHAEPSMVVEYGYKVGVNRHTQAQMSLQQVRQKPEPYGTCSDLEGYVRNVCIEDCRSRYMLSECGCQSPLIESATWDSNITLCEPMMLMECIDPAYYSFYADDKLQELCDCPDQCYQNIYPSTLTASETSEYFREWAAAASQKSGRNIMTTVQIVQEYVLLDVFFSKLEYELLQAYPSYTLLSLLCDVGGALGLLLGSTVLTVFEVGDFLFVALWESFFRKTNTTPSNF